MFHLRLQPHWSAPNLVWDNVPFLIQSIKSQGLLSKIPGQVKETDQRSTELGILFGSKRPCPRRRTRRRTGRRSDSRAGRTLNFRHVVLEHIHRRQHDKARRALVVRKTFQSVTRPLIWRYCSRLCQRDIKHIPSCKLSIHFLAVEEECSVAITIPYYIYIYKCIYKYRHCDGNL